MSVSRLELIEEGGFELLTVVLQLLQEELKEVLALQSTGDQRPTLRQDVLEERPPQQAERNFSRLSFSGAHQLCCLP